MSEWNIVELLLGAAALVVAYRKGWLQKLLAPSSPPPAPAQTAAPAAPPAPGPGYILVREQAPPAPPAPEGPVHEATVNIPYRISVKPQPPEENRP